MFELNEAHQHLLINHIPILGVLFASGILLAGIFMNNKILKNCAYILIIISSICAFLAMNSGEGAEELVEDMPNIGHQIIHEHEEIAKKFAIVMHVLSGLSILGLLANFKNHSKSKLLSILIAVLGIVCFAIGTQVGTSGGEIRHTEIRAKFNPSEL